MIDLSKEKPITLKAARCLPELSRDGRRLDLSTLYRWSKAGISRNGRQVKLPTVMQGPVRVTTREAIVRFFAELSGEQVPGVNHQKLHDAAERELDRAGI